MSKVYKFVCIKLLVRSKGTYLLNMSSPSCMTLNLKYLKTHYNAIRSISANAASILIHNEVTFGCLDLFVNL